MPEQPDFFRDYGVIPHDLPPPPETVRAYLSAVQIFGQYLATALLSGLGVGMALLCGLAPSYPENLLMAMAMLA